MTRLRPAPDEPIFHPAYLRALIALLHEEGGDVAAVLAHAGIAPHDLADDSRMLPLATVRWLVIASQRAAPRPTLALDAGARVRPAQHGVVGTAVASAPDLRSAVTLHARLLPLRTGTFRARLEPVGDGVRYVVEPRLDLGDIARFVFDHVIASDCALFAQLAGGPLDEATVELPWPRPPWHAAYGRLAGRVTWRAGRLAVVLPAGLLERVNPHADAAVHAAARRDGEAALAAGDLRGDFTAAVRALLRRADAKDLALGPVAAALGVSARTVVRRLGSAGQNFQLLRDDECRARAAALLERGLPVAEVAATLGYSQSNFARSFRRWFGNAPVRGTRTDR